MPTPIGSLTSTMEAQIWDLELRSGTVGQTRNCWCMEDEDEAQIWDDGWLMLTTHGRRTKSERERETVMVAPYNSDDGPFLDSDPQLSQTFPLHATTPSRQRPPPPAHCKISVAVDLKLRKNLAQLFAELPNLFCVLGHTEYMPPEVMRT